MSPAHKGVYLSRGQALIQRYWQGCKVAYIIFFSMRLQGCMKQYAELFSLGAQASSGEWRGFF